MARKLGQLEVAALAYVQMRTIRAVRTGDLAAALRITAKQERELLSRMARAGMIAKVRNGLYLFPAKLPLGGVWTPDDATAINALITDKQARYQITGPNAFNRYGYDEQIPSRMTLYNDAISGERRVGRVNLTLIKVARNRLGGTEQVQMPSGETLVYSSRIRTLVDAVYDWSRFDSLPRAFDWIRRDVAAGLISVEDLTNMAIRYGNTGSVRRIGALLEEMEADERFLRKLQRALRPSSAKIPFVPNRPTRGPLLKRWGIVINA
jgi:predicted transcriptional regulator of viral defense system